MINWEPNVYIVDKREISGRKKVKDYKEGYSTFTR
jgi:hypothetical protein